MKLKYVDGKPEINMTQDEYNENFEDKGICLRCGGVDDAGSGIVAQPCETCGEEKVMSFETAMSAGMINIREDEVGNK